MDATRLSRPAQVCRALLCALDAAEGRRRSRKRDQTPDAIGLTVKRELLERAIAEDPDPVVFEAWLLDYSHAHEGAWFAGAVSAMTRVVLDEWRLAHEMREFSDWLGQAAPSDDALSMPRADDAAPLREDSSVQTAHGAE